MKTILQNKIPPGDNLLKRAHYGPHWCYLCRSDNESVQPLFLDYTEARKLWDIIIPAIAPSSIWAGITIIEAWQTWYTSSSAPKQFNLPLLICWAIWIAQNHLIFQNSPPRWSIIAAKVLASYTLILDDPPP